MLADDPSTGRFATCEEWDDEAGTTLRGTKTSANVASRQSEPELVPREYAGMSRTSTSTPDVSHRMKGEETFGRESRPYSSGPPERHRRNSSRRNSVRRDPSRQDPSRQDPGRQDPGRQDPGRQDSSRPAVRRIPSEAERPGLPVRHQSGQCWVCDYYGYHIVVPPDSKEKCIRKSQNTASQAQPETSRPQPSAVQPRSIRSHSSRDRPMSFHGGMVSSEICHPLALQQFSGHDWSSPPTPVSPYPHTPSWQPFPDGSLPSTPVSAYPSTNPFHNHYQDYQPAFPQPYPEQGPPPPRPRPTESYREVHGEPTIPQSSSSWDQPTLMRTTSQQQHRSQSHSLSRQEDMKKMPPPPKPRRPSMVKGNTSVSHHQERGSNTSISQHRSSTYDSVPALPPARKSDAPPPPSSYRELPHSAYQERPVHGKSTSYQDAKKADNFDRRDSPPSTERSLPSRECHEVEAEAYQQFKQKKKPHPLTLDALSKIPPQENSNTSSRGSSGGKTRTTAGSTDITMMISGLTLGIDSAEHHKINIHTKRNGGVNITVHDKTTSLHDRSGSSESSYRHRRSSVKELTGSGKRGQSLGPKFQKAIQASNRSGEALYDDSQGVWS